MKSYQFAAPAALAAIWAVLNFGECFKVLGHRGGYVTCIAFPLLAVFVLCRLARWDGTPHGNAVIAALFGGWLFATAAYLVLHHLSVRRVFGPGSDREDALRVACHALLSGSFPYRHVTFLNHPITPMPGALLFAMPSYALGQVGLQNLVWMAAFLYGCYRFFDRRSSAVWFALVFVLFNPCIMQDFVTGGDFFTNFVYVVVLFSAVLIALEQKTARWQVLLLPLLLGVALASRPIYSLLYPCLLAFAWQVVGARVAVRTVTLALVAELGVTLPVYLKDPVHFTPFTVGGAAYSFIPAALHPGALVFAVGLLVASSAFFVRLGVRKALTITGAAITVVTLPLFLVDRAWSPELFPLINLIYLSPGLLLVAMWLVFRMDQRRTVPGG